MSDNKIWFGTLYDTKVPGTSTINTNAQMSWVPQPDTGMQASSVGYTQALEYENGGSDVVSSGARRAVYSMDWNLREASGASGLDIIRNYSQRFYGPGCLYWSNPMHFDQNLLAPAWASPGLIEQGWKNTSDYIPAFTNTSSNIYSQPRRKATWTLTPAAGAAPTLPNSFMVVPIPPSHTLWLGFSGAKTGTSAVRVRPINSNGSYASTTDLTLLTDTSLTRLNASFSGANYKAVEIYFTRTSTVASTLTLTSAMAQLWPTGTVPILTGSHIAGTGDTGCKFMDDAQPQTYVLVDSGRQRHLKGLSANLTEVGAWQTA